MNLRLFPVLPALAVSALAMVPSRAATFTVSTVSDSGPGSFRQAILEANANGSGVSDQIIVDLPAGPLVPQVALLSPLPPITSPCEITAANPVSTAAIHLQVPAEEHGLRVESDSVYLRHLSIEGAGVGKANVIFSGVSFGGVFDCRINEAGSLAVLGRISQDGVLLARGGFGGANYSRDVEVQRCTIMGASRAGVYAGSFGFAGFVNGGGTGNVRDCLIRRCGEGIVMDNASNHALFNGVRITGNTIDTCTGNGIRLVSTSALLSGNRLGLVVPAAALTPNGGAGLAVTGTARRTQWDTTVENNILSGNAGSGVLIDCSEVEGSIFLSGNFIGPDAAGTAARANGANGVHIVQFPGSDTDAGRQVILGAMANPPGSPAPFLGQRNVISGNTANGIFMASDSVVRGVQVRENFIGTTVSGLLPLANGGAGISLGANVRSVRIGVEETAGGSPQPHCLIGGNTGGGIRVTPIGTGAETVEDLVIRRCLIGATPDQTRDLSNGPYGILLSGNVRRVQVLDSLLAASLTGLSVNLPTAADPALTNLLVRGNHIGTNAAAEPFFLRNLVGIDFLNGDQIGITANVLAGNELHGLRLQGGTHLTVVGNSIGVPGAANGSHGVVLQGSTRAQLAGNTISNNRGDGIVARDTVYCQFTGNRIYGNTGLGLNLQPAGEPNSTPTANDPGDADGLSFPNAGMNHPVITSATVAGGQWTISGTLDSLQSLSFPARIQLFGTSYLRWSGRPHADAEVLLGSVDTAGSTWTLTVPEQAGIAFLSATATLTSATSELSAPLAAPDGSFRLEITSMEYVPPISGGPPTAFGYYLHYTCRPGKRYELQVSSTMTAGTWLAESSRRPDYPGTDRFFVAYQGGRRFWRIVELP